VGPLERFRWRLSYAGTYDGDGMLVPPGEERTDSETRVGHHFVIRRDPGGDRENLRFDLGTVTTAARPSFRASNRADACAPCGP